MAELGSTSVSGHRDNVYVPGGGRNRDLSACAIRARDPLNSVQAVTPGKPAPRVGPSPISITSGKLVASMEPEDLYTPPFTAQERLIYVPVDILNIRVGALLDSGAATTSSH